MATAAVARAELEALLRTRKLDRTLPGPTADQSVRPADTIPTGVPMFDQALGGGWPRGEMSEIVGPRSSGCGSMVAATLAGLTRQGGIAAFVDTLDMLDPESMAAAGVLLDRVLWVRGDASCQAGPAITGRLSSVVNGQDRALDRAVKGVNLVLQAGGFDLVVLDLREVQPEALRRLPFTTWFRLQRTLENSRTVCLLAGASPTARGNGGVTLQLGRPGSGGVRGGMRPVTGRRDLHAPTSGQWLGEPSTARLFTGLDIEARVIRSRVPDGATRTVRSVAGDLGTSLDATHREMAPDAPRRLRE